MSSEAVQPFGPDVYSGTHRAGPISWGKIKRAGAGFAIIKKSQGSGYQNPYHLADLAEAVAQGLFVGSYHMLSYNYLPADQVPAYLSGLPPFQDGYHFQPILDFEDERDTGEEVHGYPPAYKIQWAHDWVVQCHARTGLWAIVYSYPEYINNVLADVLPVFDDLWDKCPLWVADYTFKTPRKCGMWPVDTFHQYTSTGTLDGIIGHADLNRFNGGLTGLRKMAGQTA